MHSSRVQALPEAIKRGPLFGIAGTPNAAPANKDPHDGISSSTDARKQQPIYASKLETTTAQSSKPAVSTTSPGNQTPSNKASSKTPSEKRSSSKSSSSNMPTSKSPQASSSLRNGQPSTAVKLADDPLVPRGQVANDSPHVSSSGLKRKSNNDAEKDAKKKSTPVNDANEAFLEEMRRSGYGEEMLQRFKSTGSSRPSDPKNAGNLLCPDLPSSCNRRVCPFCSNILSFKKTISDQFSGSTISDHVNNSCCPFIRANTTQGSPLKCDTCQLEFSVAKTMNSRFLTHILFVHDKKFRCIFCNEMVNLTKMFNHVKHHAKIACANIECKRCMKKFQNARDFFLHLKEVHLIVSPNIQSFNNSVIDDIQNRNLVLFGILLAKHSCLS